MEEKDLAKFVKELWEKEGGVIDTLKEYIKIPNQSPDFDPEWEKNGYLDQAINLLQTWCEKQKVPNLTIEKLSEKTRTPILFFSLPARECVDTTTEVFLYGHCDKQPPLPNLWREGLGPYTPVIEDGKLYGRGGADDGYSTFTMITLMQYLETHKIPHPKITALVEACEESGSNDLEYFVKKLIDDKKLGKIGLIICLDSGCGNYSQFWLTSSLRGIVGGVLKVEILKEGSHSGLASGIVPSSFRIARKILARLEDVDTGKILPNDFYVDIPKERIQQAHNAAKYLGDNVWKDFPFVDGAKPVTDDIGELLLNRTWRPQLEITGADGFPPSVTAGNVLRPYSALKVSLRIPPHLDQNKAAEKLKELLEANPPYGAKVHFDAAQRSAGWSAPLLADWLNNALEDAGKKYYGKDVAHIGEGGTIPFMAMLGAKFPEAQFVVTGVLGPSSNAHAPNEFLHIEMGEKVTCVVTDVVRDYAKVLNKKK